MICLVTWFQIYKKRKIAISTLAQICTDICEEIEDLHNEDLTYKKINPGNVLVSKDPASPKAKLRKLTETKAVQSWWSLNHLIWLAPEDDMETDVTFTSETFSLGLLLVYIMTRGNHLFTWDANETPDQTRENIRKFNPNWDIINRKEFTALKNLISSMVTKEVDDRVEVRIVLEHPFFWSVEESWNFVIGVGRDTKTKADVKEAVLLNAEKLSVQINWMSRMKEIIEDDCSLQQFSAMNSFLESCSDDSILGLLDLFVYLDERSIQTDISATKSNTDLQSTLLEAFPGLVTFLYCLLQDPRLRSKNTWGYYEFSVFNAFRCEKGHII